MSITTSIRRHGSGLFAIGAVAALAAGCGAVAPTADGTVSGSGDGQSDVRVAAGTNEGQGEQRADGGTGGSTDGADRDKGSDGQGQDGDDATSGASLPESWAGTVSTERFAPGDTSAYLAMVHLHGDASVDSMSADQIENTEFLGSFGAQCEGEAVLGGTASSCTFVDAGESMSAQVRMVETGFGNTALMFGVSGEGESDLAVAPEAEYGLQSIGDQDIAEVTAEDLEGAALSAVMMGYRMDGDLPEGLEVSCEVSDGGEHGVCEVTGTPDGGGDGTWYATAQRGYDGDRDAYLFTRLPQE